VADIIWGNGKTGDANKPTDNPACGFTDEKCPSMSAYHFYHEEKIVSKMIAHTSL
jgi:hypothetical protein